MEACPAPFVLDETGIAAWPKKKEVERGLKVRCPYGVTRCHIQIQGDVNNVMLIRTCGGGVAFKSCPENIYITKPRHPSWMEEL